MRIEISDRQKACRIPRAEAQRLCAFFLQRVRMPTGSAAGREGELALAFLDDAGMRRMNRRVFGRDETTDVISCRYEPIPGEGASGAADVFVNAERALAEGAQRRGWDAGRELALYVAHGCDHLSGADDGTPAGRQRMRRRELRWLRDAGRLGLLAGLIERAPQPRAKGRERR